MRKQETTGKSPVIRRSMTSANSKLTKTISGGVRSENDTDIASETAREKGDEESAIEAIILPHVSPPPPWPEWSDQYINDESWKDDLNNPFEDRFPPTNILQTTNNYTWVRPAEYGPTPPAVVKLHSSVIDLITPNAHLCEKSELIRYILSEISELYEYSLQNKSADCEGEGVAYVPNYGEGDKRWTPWSHIYSCCKAGVRGEKPAYNPGALYYVRLYFMGAWRRIAVDDRIPILSTDHHGLPLTDTNELWPMLLTKALLKIAFVTWNDYDGKRFSVISALTGWVFEWVDSIDGVNEEELWIDLTNTLPKYSDPKRIPSCYTLLKPSKKKKLMPEEGNDTWWMPSYTPAPKTVDEVTFTDDELEPLEHTGDELISFLEIQWSRVQTPKKKKTNTSTSAFPTTGGSTVDTIPADSVKEISIPPAPPPTKLHTNAGSNHSNKKGKKAGAQTPPPKNKKVEKEKPKKREPEKGDKANDEPAKQKQGEPTTTATETETELEQSSSGNKINWMKLKSMVMGPVKQHMNPKISKSLSKASLDKDIQHLEELDHKIEEYREAVQAKTHSGLPSIVEILYGVQKFSGIDYRTKIRNWETVCGKDSPIALVVVLKVFPKPEDSTGTDLPGIPSFLQHPIQLTEIRDTALQKVDEDRPQTPLWKRFRWKAWAMQKGLIPMEEQAENAGQIHAIKAKTPFVFKTDWYKNTADDGGTKIALPVEWAGEGVYEYEGEGAEYMNMNYFTQDMNDEDGGSSTLPPLTQNININGIWSTRKMSRDSDASSKHKESFTNDKKLRLSNTDKRNSQGEDKSQKGGSQTQILYESEYAEGDSEEEALDDSFRTPAAPTSTPASPIGTENAAPNAACATVWFACADVAKNLKKFCKFYKSQSIFGSCYILRREPTISAPMLDPIFQEISSNLPQYPSVIKEFKQQYDGMSYSVQLDRFKSYSVTDYHLNEKEGIDSGFYLFSDSWTEQELIITVDLLQEDLLKNYTDITTPHTEPLPAVPPPTANLGVGFVRNGSTSQGSRYSRSARSGSDPSVLPPSPSALHFIVEPWSWKKDNCRSEPLISTTIDEYWITHLRLPPGRNTFRIWLLMQNDDTSDEAAEAAGEDGEGIAQRRNFVSVPFSVRIVSQTPIYVGSRIEVQNYMTNFPTLLLKQAERLANCIWGLFACFGRKLHIYQQSLEHFRRAYCPKANEPKMISTFARGVHDTFTQLFIALITHLNGGMLDRTLVLTLQVLFLDPTIGDDFIPMHKANWRPPHEYFTKKSKFTVLKATGTIQRYYRGWRTRRLFHMRQKGHRDFKKIEYNVRRIAYLLAKDTDSVFSLSDDFEKDETLPDEELDRAPLVPPTILPEPPYWSLDFMKYILEAHPWLVNIYPHVNCAPSHIKIQEFQGELPELKEFSKCPFFKILLIVPKDSKACFCEIDLQVYPTTGIYLKVQNNDTKEPLSVVNNRLYIGSLGENEHGYTIQCYRWAFPGMPQELTDRAPSDAWKIRVISPQSHRGPLFQEITENQRTSLIDETDEESDEEDKDDIEVCIDDIGAGEYSREEQGEGTEEDEMEEDEVEHEDEEEEMQSEEESVVPELK